MIAEAVAMLDGAGQHVSDRLDAAMRMPRKSGQVVRRPIVSEVVEQQKRIEVARISEPEGAPQPDARTFQRRLRLTHLFNRSD